MPRQGLFVLFVPAPQLPRFFLVITDISPRDAIDPEWMCITEFADQEIPVKIRYHGYIAGIPAITEPGRIVIRKLYVNRFGPAFLRIVNTLFHMLCLLSSTFFFYKGGSVPFTSEQMVPAVRCMMTSMALK
jgi:hypothetical protein